MQSIVLEEHGHLVEQWFYEENPFFSVWRLHLSTSGLYARSH